jgi:hypothetical protein
MVHRVTRYFFPLVAAFSLGRAAAPEPAGFSDSARWLPGSYDTFRQAGDDEARGTPYRHVRAVLKIVALDGESLGFAGKPVFYLEQALDGQLAQPYRQRVLVLDAGAFDVATLWDYRIANPELRMPISVVFCTRHKNDNISLACSLEYLAGSHHGDYALASG